jgi:hypothetical protein
LPVTIVASFLPADDFNSEAAFPIVIKVVEQSGEGFVHVRGHLSAGRSNPGKTLHHLATLILFHPFNGDSGFN